MLLRLNDGLISGTTNTPNSVKHQTSAFQSANTLETCGGRMFTICLDSDNHSKTGWSKPQNSPQLHALFVR